MIESKGHSKLSDEVRLRSVERQTPTDHMKQRSSPSLGNDIIVDTGWCSPPGATGQIKKVTAFEIEHR